MCSITVRRWACLLATTQEGFWILLFHWELDWSELGDLVTAITIRLVEKEREGEEGEERRRGGGRKEGRLCTLCWHNKDSYSFLWWRATTNAIIEIPLMKLTFLVELKSANCSSVRYPLQQTKVLMLYLTNTNCPYTITYRSIKIFIPKFFIMGYAA